MWILLSMLLGCSTPEVEPVATPEEAVMTLSVELETAVERHDLRDRAGADAHWLAAHRAFERSIAHQIDPDRSLRLQYQLGTLRRRLGERRSEPGPEVKAWVAAVETEVKALPEPEEKEP